MKNLVFLILAINISNFSLSQTGPGGVEQSNGASALELWLKADSSSVYEDTGSDLAESGDDVAQWNDYSGFGRNIQQSNSARRPSFITNALNGLPVIRFTNTNSEYLGPLSIDAFQNNYSIFMVAYTRAANQDFIAVTFPIDHGILLESATSNRLRFLHRNPTGVSGGNSLIAGSTRSNGSSQILSFSRGNPGSGTQQFWINGSDNQSLTGTNASYSSAGNLVFGRLANAYSLRYLNGDIAEVIILSKEVNAAERIIIENYLSAKYGLVLAANDVYNEDELGAGDFDFDVAGIGRVNASNIHDDAQGTGMVRILNPTGLGNNEFLMWGHDNGAKRASEITDIPGSLEARLERVWRISEVNSSGAAVDVGSVDIRFDLSGLGTVNPAYLRLLVDSDNDGVFNDESPISGATSVGGNVYEFSGISSLENNLRFTLGTTSLGQTPLPIELVYFNAIPENNRIVNLSWQTSTEIDNDFFTVERSLNGLDWEDLTTIDGAGNSNVLLNYSALDSKPYNGDSYYRLKQTDFDGQFQYSQIESVKLNTLSGSGVLIYPNPTNNQIKIVGEKFELDEIKVFDTLGKNVSTNTHILKTDDSTVIVDLSELSNGMYFVKTKTTSNKVYKK